MSTPTEIARKSRPSESGMSGDSSPRHSKHLSKLHSISHTLEEVANLEGHSRAVYSIAFSQDGQFAVTGSADKTAKLWSFHTGHTLYTFHGHEQWVQAVSFANNIKKKMMIATGSDDNYVRIFEHDASASSLAEGWTMKAELGRSDDQMHAHTLSVLTVAFDPTDDFVVSGSADTAVKLWRVHDKECALEMLGHLDWVSKVAYSPDGMVLASSSYDETVKLWRVSDGDELLTCEGHENFVSCVAWSHDGNRIATTSGDYSVRVWLVRMPGGEMVTEPIQERVMYGHRGWVLSCTFSPFSDRIASSSADKSVILWDTATYQAVERFQLPDWVEDVAYVPGQRLEVQLTTVGHFVDAITWNVTGDSAQKVATLKRNSSYTLSALQHAWARLSLTLFGPPPGLSSEEVTHIREVFDEMGPDDQDAVPMADFLTKVDEDDILSRLVKRYVYDEVVNHTPHPRTVRSAIEQHQASGATTISLEELMVSLEGSKYLGGPHDLMEQSSVTPAMFLLDLMLICDARAMPSHNYGTTPSTHIELTR